MRNLLPVITCLLFAEAASAQAEGALSVASMMHYEPNPVELYTGTPSISIPLYRMPTTSPEITVDISLSYNPASVVSHDSLSGNCGRGWNLSLGGSLSRPGKATGNESAWYFNAMGISGKFGNSNVLENKGNVVVVSATSGGYVITDDKGYKYTFSDFVDQYPYVSSVFDPDFNPLYDDNLIFPYKTAYYLKSVKDGNGVTLASFDYTAHNITEDYFVTPYQTKVNVLKSVTIPGYGEIIVGSVYSQDDRYTRFQYLTIKDFHGNTVKSISFDYDGHKLTGVGSGPERYTLDYKPDSPVLTHYTENVDNWGYYTVFPAAQFKKYDRSKTRHPSAEYAMKGVLEKMTLPTGGCIIYDYELNTYSYKEGRPVDKLGPGTDPDYFTRPTLNNSHNFSVALFASHDFTAPGALGDFYFSVTGSPKALVFQTFGEGFTQEFIQGHPMTYYPGFGIYKSDGSSIENITDNGFLAGYGEMRVFPVGSYKVKFIPGLATWGTVNIMEATLNSVLKKELWGNGIRIKKIGYFADGNVSPDQYCHLGTAVPEKEISYGYNLFDDPARSSGNLDTEKTVHEWHYLRPWIENTRSAPNVPTYYKNVTVSTSGNAGRTTYNYISPIDYPRTLNVFEKYRMGHPIEVIDYNAAGDTIRKLRYDYQFQDTGHITDGLQLFETLDKLGWVRPGQVREKLFYATGQAFETTTNMTYYETTRKLKQLTRIAQGSAEELITKYFYADIMLTSSQNRLIDIARVENYRNTELLSTSKINYSAEWTPIPEGIVSMPNESTLPQSREDSKGAGDLKTKARFNYYDSHGHLLESEQEKGMKTVYLWGYRHSSIVAKIGNAAYFDIPKTNIDAIRDASDSGNEATLLTALEDLRALPVLADSMVTTYTYKPLIGLSSVTDPTGRRMTYHYDTYNRLEMVKDDSGRILGENEYNYATQP